MQSACTVALQVEEYVESLALQASVSRTPVLFNLATAATGPVFLGLSLAILMN